MVTRRPRGRHRHGRGEDGSTVVVALVLATVVAILAAALVTRVASDADSAARLHDRVVARRHAEHALLTTLAVAPATDWGERLLAHRPVDAPVPVDVSGDTDERLRTLAVSVRSDPDGRTSTVRARATTPTVTTDALARIRPLVAADLVWFSEHRALDPVLQGIPRADCAAPPGADGRSAACRDEPLRVRGLDGPLHGNEGVELPTDVTITAATSSSHLTADVSPAQPTLGDGSAEVLAGAPYDVIHRPELRLPRRIDDVLAEVEVTCRFRGPTLLRFDGPTLHVRSPRSVPRAGDPLDPEQPIGCPGVDRAALASGASIVLPARAVITVVRDPVHDCVAHPLGIAEDDDTERTWPCTGGDAFVWGRYAGERTVVAEDDVQLVWDVEPAVDVAGPDVARDLLGLVAGDSVVLRRPVGPAIRRLAPFGQNLPVSGPGLPPFGDGPLAAPTAEATVWDSPRIVAALVALRGSVGVQNPFRGEPGAGPVTVVGSVANRFPGVFGWDIVNRRGAIVATTGYALDLSEDPRLREHLPPGLPALRGGGFRVLTLEVG